MRSFRDTTTITFLLWRRRLLLLLLLLLLCNVHWTSCYTLTSSNVGGGGGNAVRRSRAPYSFSFLFRRRRPKSALQTINIQERSSSKNGGFGELFNGKVEEDTSSESDTSSSSSSYQQQQQQQEIIMMDTIAQYDKTEEQSEFLDSVIKTSVFVGELSEGLSSQMIASFKPVEYKKGTVLCYEGETEEANSMYVIENGECSVFREGRKLPEPYGTMTRGTIVGEMALLYDSPRKATVIAKTNITVFTMNKNAFKHFLHLIPAKEEELKQALTNVDKVIDKVSGFRTKYGGDVIQRFKPSRRWLWTRWTGTILQQSWKTAVINMIITMAVVMVAKIWAKPQWQLGMLPDSTNNIVIAKLLGLIAAWKYVQTITTFTLSFFLTQAYGLWKNIYNTARIVQGHLNDVNLLLACSAERDENTGCYTSRAKECLEDVSRYTRLYHVFMWATFSSKLNVLLTDLGIRRMIGRGVISREQYKALRELKPEILPQHACIVWIINRSLQGMRDGAIHDDVALRDKIYERSMELQGHFAGVASQLAGKIPLAYAHFVQILVDTFLLLAPLALYSELGIWSIPSVGILTLFYSGLLDLSKILLHPLGNDDDTYDDSVNMDLAVIIRESNAGSTRWMDAGNVVPFRAM